MQTKYLLGIVAMFAIVGLMPAYADQIYVSTEQDTYIPNQTVFFDGLIYSEKNPQMVHYLVSDPNGQTVEQGNLLVTDFTFKGDFFITPVKTVFGNYIITINNSYEHTFLVVESLESQADHEILIHVETTPLSIIVKVGESVRWITEDTIVLIDPIESTVTKVKDNIHTFETAGTYFYYDRDNAIIRGEIQVGKFMTDNISSATNYLFNELKNISLSITLPVFEFLEIIHFR